MMLEQSCGAVVFTRRNGQILYVVVEEQSGRYSLSKGHMEGNETPLETARREIFEETSLQPRFIDDFCQQEEYDLSEKPGRRKRVTYFLAEFDDEMPVPRPGEIARILLLPYEEAYPLFPRENTRQILAAAHAYLTR